MGPKEGRKPKPPGKINALSDIIMQPNTSCDINVKPSKNKGSSSCDSSDSEDEPVVKRPRKTTRRVLDPSQILSSNHIPANVYTTIAKQSIEEINSSKLDYSECRKETNEKKRKESGDRQKSKKISLTESEDDFIDIGSESSSEENGDVSLACSQSPEPPSPPPPVEIRPTRNRNRAFCKMTTNLNKIEKNLKKINNALNSESVVDQCLDNSVIIVDEEELQDDDFLDTSLDTFNKQINVKIKIGSEIKRFTMQTTDTFCKLFSFLAKEKEVSETRLMLLLNEKTVHQTETPDSIQLQVSDILDCLITAEDDEQEFSERTGPNIINLVIQSGINHKSKKIMQIGKFEMLQGIIDIYAKQHKLPAVDLKLRFDGEIIDTSKTPADLDMEDEDCLDLIQV